MFCSQFDTTLAPIKSKVTHQQISACPKVISNHLKNVKIYKNLALCFHKTIVECKLVECKLVFVSLAVYLGNTANGPYFHSGPLLRLFCHMRRIHNGFRIPFFQCKTYFSQFIDKFLKFEEMKYLTHYV